MSENPFQAPSSTGAAAIDTPSAEVENASQNRRLVNFLIDQVVLRGLTFAAGFVLGMAYGSAIVSSGRQITQADEAYLNVIGFIVGLMVVVLYYIVLEGVFKTTVGKLFTSTQVVNEHGSEPTMNQIVVRSFCRLIPFEPFSFLFGDTTTGWHDSISNTRVIMKRT